MLSGVEATWLASPNWPFLVLYRSVPGTIRTVRTIPISASSSTAEEVGESTVTYIYPAILYISLLHYYNYPQAITKLAIFNTFY